MNELKNKLKRNRTLRNKQAPTRPELNSIRLAREMFHSATTCCAQTKASSHFQARQKCKKGGHTADLMR